MQCSLIRYMSAFAGVLLAASLVAGCGSDSPANNNSTGATATTTSLVVSTTSTTIGSTVRLTATVSPTTASGTIVFYNGSSSLGSASLSSGTAVLTTSFDAAGTYSLTAAYSGSSSYKASTSSAASLSVSALTSTTTRLLTSATTAGYGAAITLTATLNHADATGTVTFYDNSTALDSTALASGSATVTVSTLSVGAHSITAVYDGSATYAPSTSLAAAIKIVASGESWNIDTGANPEDMVENTSFAYTINFDLSTLSATSSSGDLTIDNTAGTISLDGSPVVNFSQNATLGLTINASFPAGTYVEYVLTGSYAKCVTIFSADKFKLTLDGAAIASTNGPAINIQSKVRAFVVLPSGTTTTLSDTSTYTKRYLSDGTTQMDLKAAFFSEGSLIFSGSGALNITGVYKHVVCSDRHIRVRGGTITLADTTTKNGIHTTNAFVMDGGTVTITTPHATGGKGIKVEGAESDTQPLGFIAINDGTLNINTNDKAITASWETSEDGDLTATSADPDPRVTINGGTINITTTGTPVEDVLAPEGIESKSVLTINGGSLEIGTTDDSLNAIKGLAINGGYIHVVSSANDAIDSNGYMTITGGVIVAHGTVVPEGAFDCDQNTFTVTGGLFIGLAGDTSNPTASVSTQNSVILRHLNATGLLVIKDSSGNVAFASQIPDIVSTILLSSPSLATGTSYSIYTGGSLSSWGQNFNGLYVEPSTYTGGTLKSTFTVSSALTMLTL
jgi:hypothetical protein